MVNLRDDGTAIFDLYLPHAQDVCIVGDFTSWADAAERMTACRDPEHGWWRAQVRLPAGEHTFSYLVNGCNWLPDYAAGGLHRNAEGRWVSVLRVPAREQVVRPRPDRPAVVRSRGGWSVRPEVFNIAAQNARRQSP